MMGISEYLSDDHERLDSLLSRAAEAEHYIDLDSYADFRKGLLRHIGIEEKIVLPGIARFQNGEQAGVAQQIRLDHGALVALLVPPPTHGIISTIRLILKSHNAVEESEDGVYHFIDELAGEESYALLEKMESYPDVPVLPHKEMAGILDVTRRAVERAGYKAGF